MQKIWIMFEKLKHIKRQCLIKHRFDDMTQQPHDQLRPTLKELGCRGLPVFAPYVKNDELFYIVDKFQIIPIKFSWTTISLLKENAAIKAVAMTNDSKFNSREVLIRIVFGRKGHGITITFEKRKSICEEDMELPLYRTDMDAMDHRIYKGVVNILDMPFYPEVSSARMKGDILYLHYWKVGSDNMLGTVPKKENYVTSTLFFKENGITVGNRFLDAIPGDPVYKTKEEAENVIYRSLLQSYYKNNTPKASTETFCHQ